MSGDMRPGDDDELRARFRELKAHDARTAPSFDALLQRPRRTARARSPLVIVLPVTAALALAAALLLVVSFQSDTSPAASASSRVQQGGEVAAARIEPLPLDFLLTNTSVSGAMPSSARFGDVSNPIKGW